MHDRFALSGPGSAPGESYYESEIIEVRQQDLIRKVLVVGILVLIVLLVILLACLITNGTCSNAVNNGILPMNSAAPTAVIDAENSASPEPAESSAPVTETPEIVTPEPTAVPVEPTEPPAPQGPVIPQSPYPSIPYCVTEGTMQDVHTRLEYLKQLPKSETIILLDVGHGGFDGGTVGIDTNATEADINLAISRKLAEYFASKRYYVFMTRMGDYACASDKNSDMRWRKNVMKLDIFDISVSIHQNALGTDRSVCGARIYSYKNGTEAEKLAKAVIEEITKISSTARKNVYTGNLMVVREPICPAILVECGFLSNHDEELLLQDPNYQQQLVQAIADGAENYLKSR